MNTIVITGLGVVSAIGVGADAFTTGWTQRRSGITDASGMYDEKLPYERAGVVAGFDVVAYLGKKGTSSYDRTTAMTVVAVKLALEDAGRYRAPERDDEMSVILGATTGALQATVDFMHETCVSDPPYLVNPMKFPYAVMNGPASAAAIRHRLGGANVTISGGQVAMHSALGYARRHLASGHGPVAAVGVVDEFTPARAWASKLARDDVSGRAPIGEAAVFFVVEDVAAARAAGRRVDAEILAVVSGLYGYPGSVDDSVSGFVACIRTALERAGVAPDEVWAVASSLGGSPRRDAIEQASLATVFGTDMPIVLPVKELLGETYTAAGGLQLAALLAEHRCDPARDGAISLVTSVTSEGMVGVAVVRGWSRAAGH
ncbi:beta-ketoacyl synthase N-terminal-like domain-containing protein [Nocardia sp. NPDC051052]|uniref:beta-ketoacyl synthase N-terminal-like domain-containing protein n=1 Tax=Nocardia sp. NPDC051052 TaxID=3364322 RepID=UPI003793F31D